RATAPRGFGARRPCCGRGTDGGRQRDGRCQSDGCCPGARAARAGAVCRPRCGATGPAVAAVGAACQRRSAHAAAACRCLCHYRLARSLRIRSMTHRGALIGCGFFANNHMHGWAEVAGAEIVAVCDRDAAKAEAMAQRFGIPAVYTDAAEMLAREQLDFVDIATTSGSHRALVELAALRVRLVICQKPMADTLADGGAMVAAAASAGVPLIIHENFRWQRPFREISRRLAEGQLGKVHFARFSFRHGYDNYVNQPYLAEIERFTIMDVGLHLFDLSRHLVGEAS